MKISAVVNGMDTAEASEIGVQATPEELELLGFFFLQQASKLRSFRRENEDGHYSVHLQDEWKNPLWNGRFPHTDVIVTRTGAEY